MDRSGVKTFGGIALLAAFIGTAPVNAQEIEWSDFAYWDSNESGDISQAEWEGGMESIELDLEEQPESHSGDERELYSAYREYEAADLNEDNRIDQQEFEQVLSRVGRDGD